MYRTFFFLIGFFLMVTGLTYIIVYLNLITLGYTYLEYFYFILSRIECSFLPIGFIIISLCVFTKGDRDNDLYL